MTLIKDRKPVVLPEPPPSDGQLILSAIRQLSESVNKLIVLYQQSPQGDHTVASAISSLAAVVRKGGEIDALVGAIEKLNPEAGQTQVVAAINKLTAVVQAIRPPDITLPTPAKTMDIAVKRNSDGRVESLTITRG
jgi:hypothetical protein